MYLPKEIHVVSRCADSKLFGYRRTLTARDRLCGICASTPRHVKDLTEKFRIPSEMITLIPHGVSGEDYQYAATKFCTKTGPIRLGFLGRIEHNQKGVMFLPRIARLLNKMKIDFTLDIAGRGVHEKDLHSALHRIVPCNRLCFHGSLSRSNVPSFFRPIDILLFPSLHEGFGFVLIEAMIAGCVPIASRLDGVTDYIIKDGTSGILCPVGDAKSFSDKVALLHNRRDILQQYTVAARERAKEMFSIEKMVDGYATFLKGTQMTHLPTFKPRPWSQFLNPDINVRRYNNRLIPQQMQVSLKRSIRRILFKARLSIKY